MFGDNHSPKPFFSVLLSSYNNDETIAEAIEAILNQSFQNFELILVNDGSTDLTSGIMKEFADSFDFVHFINNQINIGKSMSLNMAALMSSGEYLAIADADDIWNVDKLEIQSQELIVNPEIDVVGGQLIRFGEWGISNVPTSLPLSNLEITRSFRKGKMAINNPTSAIRRESFLRVGGYRGYFRRTEDLDLFIRMYKMGAHFKNLPNVLIRYRTNTPIQSFQYWVKAEFGRWEVVIANSSKLSRILPFIFLPRFVRDSIRMVATFFIMKVTQRRV